MGLMMEPQRGLLWTWDKLQEIFPHIFMPRKLPESTEEGKIEEHESQILKLLIVTLEEFEDSRTHQLFNTWSTFQDKDHIDSVKLKEAMSKLPEGESLALYIRGQNAGLIITIPKNSNGIRKNVIISTFPASLKSDAVLASGKPNDLARMYPAISVQVPRSNLFESEIFGNQINSLSNQNCDIAMPKTTKGGTISNEIRDVSDPMLISKWLIGAQSNTKSRMCSAKEFPRIPKKIRDDVVWKDALLPFRRSGMYMVLKVVMHLSFVQEFGEIQGNCMYKSVMIEFMSHFCGISQDLDLEMQILSKIARRLYKLDKYVNKHKLVDMLKYEKFSLKHSEILRKSRAEIDCKWNSIIEIEIVKSRTNISANIDFKSDTIHSLRKSKFFFKTETQPLTNIKFVPGSQCPPRHRQNEQFPLLQNLESTDEKIRGIVLQDIEYWVRHNFDSVPYSVHNYAIQVRDLFKEYWKIGNIYYKDDPLGYSRLVLTSLKMVQVFDEKVQSKFEILKQHRAGVSINCISNLLLPSSSDLKLAHELEHYFHKRMTAQLPSLIEEENVSTESFAVRFANSNAAMDYLKFTILRYGEDLIAAKKEELKKQRCRCAELRRQSRGRSCEYVTGRWGNQNHSWTCTKCSLENQADSINVQIYEKPLPEEEYKRLAVVFELLIPIEISCLRDVLFILASQVCSESPTSQENHSFQVWNEYHQICQHKSVSGGGNLVNLGSTVKSYLNSHYSEKHVDKDDSEFIVNNAYNTKYGTSNSLLGCSYGPVVKKACTFQVAANSSYSKLQWTLNSTNHTQNQVLSRQIECPYELHLQEFKVFGSLRAGHRLQIRNIYAALSQGNLNFKAESIYALICQSVWEAGQTGNELERIYRSSHQDFRDPNFAQLFLELLTKEREENSETWSDPLLLLTLILIGNRILSISGDSVIQALAVEHLDNCRLVAIKWVVQIKNLLGKMTQAPQEDVSKIRTKLIECAACAVLTFPNDSSRINMVMRNQGDAMDWIKSAVWIEENVVLNYAFGNDRLSIPLRNILRWVRTTGFALEPRICSIINETDGAPITSFVNYHWPGTIRQSSEWCPMESPREQIYFSEWSDQKNQTLIVEVDITFGSFLVNGAPIGRLPEKITRHPDFIRVFQLSVFEVLTEGPGIFVTNVGISDNRFAKYKFYTSGEKDRLFIEELLGDEEFHLFPHHQLESTVSDEVRSPNKEIPSLLISDYSHWWNKEKQILYFRPVLFTDKQFHETRKVKYQLDIKTKVLRDMRTGNIFVDMNRKSFKKITKTMERLEHRDFIHLMYCERTGQTTIELPRMGLYFEVEKSGRITSNEFPGMQVSKDQKFGTLVGLRHGLLLESIESQIDKIILVPHGKINIKLEETSHNKSGEKVKLQGFRHQVVRIDNKELGNPPYFPYIVDQRLQQLRAGQNHLGWLYLAYMHATTASPLPDPFNSLTGTEASIKLLQSGHCWSCEPLKKEARKILEYVSGLSPKRTYYPKNLKCMQTVEWPKGLSSLAAEDAFLLLVDKLISDSQRLDFLYPNDIYEKNEIGGNRSLSRRAYFRNSAYSSEEASVSPEFDASLNESVLCRKDNCFEISLECEVMKGVRTLAHMGHTWSTSRPVKSPSVLLTELLLSTEKLSEIQGISEEGFNQNSTVTEWLRIDFPNSWLDLYNFVRLMNSENNTELKLQWSLLSCLLAFNGISVDHLLILQTVAVNPSEFPNPPSSASGKYVATSENDFNRSRILTIFKDFSDSLEDYLEGVKNERGSFETDKKFHDRMEQRHNSRVIDQVNLLTNCLIQNWPIYTCDESLFENIAHPQICLSTALDSINSELLKWYRNRELKLFLDEVAASVTLLTSPVPLKFHEILEQEGGQTMDEFMKEDRLKLRFEDFLKNDKKFSWETAEDEEFLKIFKNGLPSPLRGVNDEEAAPKDNSNISFPFRTGSDCPVESFYNQTIQKSWDIFQTRKFNNNENEYVQPTSVPKLKIQCSKLKDRAKVLWKSVKNAIYPSDMKPHMLALAAGGLFPRVTPSVVVLPFLTRCCVTEFRNLVGTLCVVWTLEQQANRCLKYTKAGTGMEVALKRELANPGYEGWSPAKRPEWLLLQLEMDMMIRHVQIEVAEQMLSRPDKKNALMQLNMGEGKTAVIIPLLVVAIADRKQLCRVTVLRSLYQINLRRLIMNLGGLLNRRVYTFPCRRDMKIDQMKANQLLALHKECMLKSGVVLTRPEYRLSLQLKGYEKCGTEDLGGARSLLNLQQWLQDNVRDLLDESDEILQVKYQLIYTVGNQQPIAGGSMRWIIAQDVFKLLKTYMTNLKEEYGENSIEYQPTADQSETEFPQFRLLNCDSYQKICEFVTEDFIKGSGSSQTLFPDLRDTADKVEMSLRVAVKRFLTTPCPDQETFKFVITSFGENSMALEIMLILRGLLACGVLQLALTKRWRVNYGVNPKGERKMAVPFRAKDVAVEKTEFGHPDVAILFTHLSYYYSGLSDSQIEECFDYLAKSKSPAEQYDIWISGIEKYIDPSIRSWRGVNMNNFEQKTNIVFPTFRKNMVVINFWLAQVVFPKELKQFPGKMVCTAWDLCSDENKYYLTGFSGTNDSALLLPLNISQEDLPQLQGTNGQVLHNLLLEENNNYKCIRSGKTCVDILRKITKRGIRVLLDVGALILELTNEQVATEWLEILPPEDVDALVYFDESDRLVVRDRQGWSGIFETSSYGARLDRCAIYLDDVHTRGTDLKIPSGFKACVTLGKGVTKDKLVQGCMRMRMLGQGHTVHFFASQEVDNQIRVIAGIGPSRLISASAQNVLQWAMDNSCATTRDSMLYWAAAGFNFAQKKSAMLIMNGNNETESMENSLAMSEQCSNKEVVDLMSFYGRYRQEEFIPGIAQFHGRKVIKELKAKLQYIGNTNAADTVDRIFGNIGKQIIKKCDFLVPTIKLFSQLLEEEQERELEQELEEERQVERPGGAKPFEPELDGRVESFLVDGKSVNGFKEWCVKLPRALDNTTMESIFQENSWGDNIFATMDFVKVIDVGHPKDGVGKYLRTPTWIAVVKSTSNNQIKTLLLLSPFEANEYIPHFREGKFKTTLHMFSAKLRPKQDTLIAKMELGIPSQISSNSIIWENLNIYYAHLSIFAGGLYFADGVEQDFFCRLCGYIPRPRSAEEQEAFDKGWTDNGFVRSEFRKMSGGIVDQFCKFNVNPAKLIQEIIQIRHDVIPTSSHVLRVVVESKKAFE